jgi:hypothetical protein
MLGRRAALFLGSVIMLAGVALQISAWNVAVLICARILSQFMAFPSQAPLIFYLVGFGLTFCLNAAPLLLIELAYPTQVCIHSFGLKAVLIIL